MAPINLTNVSKAAPESDSTEKLLKTNQRLAQRDSISNQSPEVEEDAPFYVVEQRQDAYSFQRGQPPTVGRLDPETAGHTTPDPAGPATSEFLREDVQVDSIPVTLLDQQ